MTAERMWQAFAAKAGLPKGISFEAWAFGGDPDKLAMLAKTGVKTGTSSAFPLYGLEGEPLPEAGEYSVILDSKGEAVCVIQTTRVYLTAFSEVDAGHAYKEGEGDQSLSYWRAVHEDFFRREMAEAGLVFDGSMLVVCEEFEVVYC